MARVIRQGDKVVFIQNLYGEECNVPMVVISALNTQLRAEGEVQRKDGGWEIGSMWAFYKDEGITWRRAQ